MNARADTTTKPMLCHSEDADEAIASVANVLWFLGQAVPSLQSETLNKEQADGLRIILETCASTLDVHA